MSVNIREKDENELYQKIIQDKEERKRRVKNTQDKNNKLKNKKRDRYYKKREKVRSLYTSVTSEHNIGPHPLLLIGSKTVNNIKENYIFLSNMTRSDVNTKNCSDGGTTTFSITYVGMNVSYLLHQNNKQNNGIDTSAKQLNYVAILAQADDLSLQNDPHIHFISTSTTSDDDTYDHVLLLLYVENITDNFENGKNQHWEAPSFTWDNVNDFINLRKIKKSTIKSNKPTHHYGSQGYCFSFGLRNDFKKSENNTLSLANYAGDEHESTSKYIHFIAKHMNNSFKAFNSIIPSISSYLNFTSRSLKYEAKYNVISKYLMTFQHNDYKNIMTFITTAHININATTRDLHCEKDTTYTTICVPEQKEEKAHIVFQFQINDENTLQLDVKQHGAFTYSGYCLSHRQLATKGENCMNLSTYSAKAVYSHFRTSLKRIQKAEQLKLI